MARLNDIALKCCCVTIERVFSLDDEQLPTINFASVRGDVKARQLTGLLRLLELLYCQVSLPVISTSIELCTGFNNLKRIW